MPLLVCPNDNAAMQTVNRSGVEFDFCPSCRGVWLDRGELEKLMSAARGGEASDSENRSAAPSHEHRDRDYDRDDPKRRWDDDGHRRKKRRGFDIFDIFE
jgi:Zn-finger nucleic acid-binding protein